MQKEKRFGVIFSGGTAAGMNATLEYLCMYASEEEGGAELIGFNYGWKGLIQNDIEKLDTNSTRGIGFESGGTYLGSCSKLRVADHNGHDYSKICYQTYQSLGLDGIFVLGGDGSLLQSNELNEKFPDMKFIFIPSTLDRDILGSDITVGFFTAVKNAARKIESNVRDGTTMGRHTITECMGRESGFVTTYAVDRALRKQNNNHRKNNNRDQKPLIDMVLIPEVDFNLEGICNRISQTTRPLNIVISEGIKVDDTPDAPEEIIGHHKDLANTCKKLAAILEPHSKLPIKTEVVGYSQRTGEMSSSDIFLAEQFAKLAVKEACTNTKSMAIVFKDGEFCSVPITELIKENLGTGDIPEDEAKKQIRDKKRKILLSDPVINILRDQLSAGAFRPI